MDIVEQDTRVEEGMEQLAATAYAKADREGVDPEVLERMSVEDIRKFVETPATEEPPETESELTSVVTPESVVVQSPEPPVIAGLPDLDTVTPEQYRNLRALHDRQVGELGTLRQIVERNREFLDAAEQDPRFRQHVLGYFERGIQPQPVVEPAPTVEYDPFNPQSVEGLVSKRVKQELQAEREAARAIEQRRQAQNLLGTFNANLQAAKERALTLGYPPAVVDDAIRRFSKDFSTGNFLDHALKATQFETFLSQAEQRGYQKAVAESQKKLTEAAAVPIRTAGVGGTHVAHDTSTPESHTDCETPEQLVAYCDGLQPTSKKWEAAVRYGISRGWPGFV